jgi:hypothetical protein
LRKIQISPCSGRRRCHCADCRAENRRSRWAATVNRRKETIMTYKLWIGDENLGVLKHVENLGGSWRKHGENIYQIWGVSAGKVRELQGVFVLNSPRTPIEAAYLNAVRLRYM